MDPNKLQNTEKQSRRMTCSHNQRLRQWIGALTLIVLGVLMILRNMGMIEAKVYQLLLPTLAIGVGIWSLLNKRHYAAGILMAAVGIYFLLPRLVSGIGWTPVWPSWLTFWPLACILLGVTLLTYLFRPTYYTRSYFNNGVDETVSEAQDGFVEVNNSFGSVRHIVLDTVFKGARIRTKFSGTVLDLTRTTLGEGETYIDVDMSLSGLELRLPDGWMVVTDPLSLNLAGIEDKRYYRMASDPSRRLVIRGGMSLSGIEIKS